MLDPAFVRDHVDLVRAACTNRGADADALLSALAPLDEKRRRLIPEVESLKRDQNRRGRGRRETEAAGEDASAIADANRARGSR